MRRRPTRRCTQHVALMPAGERPKRWQTKSSDTRSASARGLPRIGKCATLASMAGPFDPFPFGKFRALPRRGGAHSRSRARAERTNAKSSRRRRAHDARKREQAEERAGFAWTMFKVLKEQGCGVRADARTGGGDRCMAGELWSKRHSRNHRDRISGSSSDQS